MRASWYVVGCRIACASSGAGGLSISALSICVQAGEQWGVFCQPMKKNEVDIDAIWMDATEGVAFLQITSAERHLLKGTRIRSLMKELNVKQAKLWFVTTEENAGNFERQKIAAVGGKEQDDMGSELEVQQSVACIRPNTRTLSE
jgi:hypothetical protein